MWKESSQVKNKWQTFVDKIEKWKKKTENENSDEENSVFSVRVFVDFLCIRTSILVI